MTAIDLLQRLQKAQIALTLATQGGLSVAPASRLTALDRADIRQHRTELLQLLRHGPTAAFVAAVNRCCDARGDNDENRAALIRECGELPPDAQADMLEHFQLEAIRFGPKEGDFG